MLRIANVKEGDDVIGLSGRESFCCDSSSASSCCCDLFGIVEHHMTYILHLEPGLSQ